MKVHDYHPIHLVRRVDSSEGKQSFDGSPSLKIEKDSPTNFNDNIVDGERESMLIRKADTKKHMKLSSPGAQVRQISSSSAFGSIALLHRIDKLKGD